MPNPLMYQEDNFVVLETNQAEQFLTAPELLAKLKGILQTLDPKDLPSDLRSLDSLEAQAQCLLDTTCELDVGPGKYLQWYAVRLSK